MGWERDTVWVKRDSSGRISEVADDGDGCSVILGFLALVAIIFVVGLIVGVVKAFYGGMMQVTNTIVALFTFDIDTIEQAASGGRVVDLVVFGVPVLAIVGTVGYKIQRRRMAQAQAEREADAEAVNIVRKHAKMFLDENDLPSFMPSAWKTEVLRKRNPRRPLKPRHHALLHGKAFRVIKNDVPSFTEADFVTDVELPIRNSAICTYAVIPGADKMQRGVKTGHLFDLRRMTVEPHKSPMVEMPLEEIDAMVSFDIYQKAWELHRDRAG